MGQSGGRTWLTFLSRQVEGCVNYAADGMAGGTEAILKLTVLGFSRMAGGDPGVSIVSQINNPLRRLSQMSDHKPACPKCGGRFVRRSQHEITTLVSFSSPAGHNHDDNCITRSYKCENDHWTIVSIQRRCPVCDWRGKDNCFCHPEKKVEAWPEIEDA